MNNPKCENCERETQWYGWLHGWLCSTCNVEQLKEDEDVEQEEQGNQSAAFTLKTNVKRSNFSKQAV